jgi:ferredoxin
VSVRRLISVDESGPLDATRGLLDQVWTRLDLQGMFIPSWSEELSPPRATFLQKRSALGQADPFAPVMLANGAADAVNLIQEDPQLRIAFVLRPCEVRSFHEILKRIGLRSPDFVIISSDCLAVFPVNDFDWRLSEKQDLERLTLDALQFAAQGGILPSRYQRSCQFCEVPYPEKVSLHIELFGLDTSQYLVLRMPDEATTEQLGFAYPTTQDVPLDITERRERVLEKITTWRGRSLSYARSHLDEAKASPEGLLQHLRTCSSCSQRLIEHCPLFDPASFDADIIASPETIETWISSCGGCGMCEHECPDDYPLFIIVAHLSNQETR